MFNLRKLKNPLICSFLFLFCLISYAQVGINTTNPNAVLDVRSSNQVNPGQNDGILIPKVDNFPSVNPTTNQDGMLLFATGNGAPNKGFYYWDNTNTSWVSLTATGGGGNTLDQAYDQGGNGLGKNINATNGAVRINGTDGFLVTGDVFYGNPIDTEITGAGTRMFFNPLMSAFRAGTVWDIPPYVGDEWDVINTGLFSTAFGVNTLASGLSSTAFGDFTNAIGNQSTAFGAGTIASGQSSTAFGYSTTASGPHSVAFGYQSTASETTTTAFGSFTSASGTYATAFGYQSSASGLASIAFGTNTNASGERATAFGIDTEASANNSTAFGGLTEASGGNATAFGFNTVASGVTSTAFGYNTVAPSSYETAIGMFNTNYTPGVAGTGFDVNDRVFVVGNGHSASQRSNALTVFKNGRININDAYDLPLTDGTANQVLTTNGSGVVSFQDVNVSNAVYSLNQSYSIGGTGSGRIINAIYGPVEIQNNGGLIVSSFNQPNMLFVDGTNDAVGIGTNAPTATLSVNGTANKPGGGTWAVFSDARLKKDVNDYKEGLELIMNVRPINFSYNDKMKMLFGGKQVIGNRVYQGVIAQDLQKIAPDMVREISLKKERFLEVNPNKFTYALINAVKEQQELLVKQNSKIEGLETQLKKQQEEIEAIKVLLKNIDNKK